LAPVPSGGIEKTASLECTSNETTHYCADGEHVARVLVATAARPKLNMHSKSQKRDLEWRRKEVQAGPPSQSKLPKVEN
jgi:hypothetical protein